MKTSVAKMRKWECLSTLERLKIYYPSTLRLLSKISSSRTLLEELMASVQPEPSEDNEGFVALSAANLSYETWNDDHSDDEPPGDDYVLVGIERTVSKLS